MSGKRDKKLRKMYRGQLKEIAETDVKEYVQTLKKENKLYYRALKVLKTHRLFLAGVALIWAILFFITFFQLLNVKG